MSEIYLSGNSSRPADHPVLFWTKPLSISHEVVRNVSSQTPEQPDGIRNSASGSTMFLQVLQVIPMHTNHILRTTDLRPSEQKIRMHVK